MSLLQNPNNNQQVNFIFSEINKLSFDDREIVRNSLAVENWQNHLHILVQQPATEDELSLVEINSIKY